MRLIQVRVRRVHGDVGLPRPFRHLDGSVSGRQQPFGGANAGALERQLAQALASFARPAASSRNNRENSSAAREWPPVPGFFIES
jgi:hypothetical protein